MRLPTSERTFWTFWSAISVSSLGDGVTAVALPLIALDSLHSGARGVSAVVAASYVSWLLIGLPAGVLVTFLQLQRLQVFLDVFRALVLATVPVAGFLGLLSLAQLVVVALLVGLASVLHEVGSSSYLPLIVDPVTLANRNGWISGGYAVAQVGGPSLGGLMVQTLGASACVFADVGSYVFSALCIRGLPRRSPGGDSKGERLTPAVRAGLAYVRRRPGLVASCVVLGALNLLCGGVQTLAPVFLVRSLHLPSLAVGVLLGTEGVGAAIGAASAGVLTTRLGLRASTSAFTASCGLATASLALARPGYEVAYFATGDVLLGFGLAGVSTALRTYRQTTTPPAMLPRVMATVRFVSWGALPVGALAAGALATYTGIRWMLLGLGCVGLVAAAYALTAEYAATRNLGATSGSVSGSAETALS